MVDRKPDPSPSQRLRRIGVSGMTLTEGVHRMGSVLGWHDHGGPTLCFVLEGAFAEYVRGGVIDCRPSTFKITPAGERHWNRFHLSDVRGLLVEIDSEYQAGLGALERVLAEPHHSEGGAESFLARRLYTEFRAEDEAATLAMEGLLLEILATVARSRTLGQQDSVPGWTRKALALLQDAPTERHSLATIASEVGVHPATLARSFRRVYGCSLGHMQRCLRIEFAAQQLATTERPLAAIAQQAGFFDQSHFTNSFRQHFGTTPLQYRRAMRASV